MREHQRAQQPQPGRRILPGNAGVAQPLERRAQAVASPFEPEQMQEQKNDQHDRHDPRFDRAKRSAPAFGRGRKHGQRAEQDERGVGGEKDERGGAAEHVP